MTSFLAPVCLIALVSGAADEMVLVSVQRLTAPADAAIVSTAVKSGAPAETAARDALAYRLLALGYSALETADIVTGRTTKAEVDRRHARRLAGYPDPPPVLHPLTITTGLPFVRTATTALPPRTQPRLAAKATAPPPPSVDAAIDRYARLHAVDPALVRAIIGEESGFSHTARSPVGAIGLMQLMPATAKRLGVNPHVIEQNIEGGIRYLAEQLREFGRTELALIAYNAGPAVAARYARGEIGLYDETRGYLARVQARLRALR
jgi:soluble lytic murein transglycosylase-like protein